MIQDPSSLPPHPPMTDYYAPAKRELFVRKLFDDTAPWYEGINTICSFGSGNWYREDALRRAGYQKGMKLLDVATGTGVVARAAARISRAQDVIGLDPSIGMLIAGRVKARMKAVEALGEKLPFRNGSFDFLSIGYAMRHLPDLHGAFVEHLRVLKPGGRIVILEITPPRSRIGFAMMRAYMNGLIPTLARIFTRKEENETLMRYYWDTIRLCVPPESILGALREAGFTDVRRSLSYGVMSEYIGVKA